MSAGWPLEAPVDEDSPLPPPWNGAVDLTDQKTESDLLLLGHADPAAMIRVCRSAFTSAQARGDQHAAVLALHLACSAMNNTGQHPQADRLLSVIVERARGLGLSQLSTRIKFNEALQLELRGEHAQAMGIRQKALEAALTLGNHRLTCFALNALAGSASRAGQDELALSVFHQLDPLLDSDDVVVAGLRGQRANNMAMTWKRIARNRNEIGDRAGTLAALQRSRELALTAFVHARNDNELVTHLETLVRILLRFGAAAEARIQMARCVASLAVPLTVGSNLWCMLELTRLRIDTHEGRASAQTVQTLRAIYERTEPMTMYVSEPLGELRHVLQRAQEQLGQYEHALGSHKGATQWRGRQRSASLRQRMKLLRHTILSMRAEEVEFITHDLLTPLAAAQTWLQAIGETHLKPDRVSSLRDAQRLLDQSKVLTDHYLGLLRAELMPRAQLQTLDMGALIDDVCENAALPQGLRLTRTIDIGTPVRGDATLLTRALTALLADAFSSAPLGTRIALRFAHDTAQGQAVLSIEHLGAGPPPQERTRLYQQSLDGDAFDTGSLGLALAAKVCRLHRMRLRFDRVPAAGCRLRLTMKTALHAAAMQPRAAAAEPQETPA